ncbi:MAG: TadE/TadG family type IV pilus assembly protein [Pirellula sp.]|jgi:Flp pilus assembly protein TadG
MFCRNPTSPLKNRRSRMRAGVACVEAAICLPVLFAIVLVGVEITNLIFLKQSLSTAAYESCRTAIQSSTTTAVSRSVGAAVLDSRGVKSYTIEFSPLDVGIAARGSVITVTVKANCAANSIVKNGYSLTGTAMSSVVMIKE